MEYVSSRPSMRSNNPANCINYYASGDAGASFYIRKDVGELYGKGELSFSINSPGGLNVPASFNSKFTLTNTHAWTTTEPWDTFKLAIAGGINTNMSGGANGDIPIGSYTFTSKESTYFQILTIAFYNQLPIGRGQWASKINNFYCIRVATYVHLQSSLNAINSMGNDWFMPGWPQVRDCFKIDDWYPYKEKIQYYPAYFNNVFIEGRFYNTDYTDYDGVAYQCGLITNNINTSLGTALFTWVLMDKGNAGSDYYAVAFHN